MRIKKITHYTQIHNFWYMWIVYVGEYLRFFVREKRGLKKTVTRRQHNPDWGQLENILCPSSFKCKTGILLATITKNFWGENITWFIL